MARFFINRPIVAMVISIVTVLLGVVAMSGLPIAQYPEIVPPMVQVTTTFVGASATDVEAAVATPIEQKVNGVENSIYMKSTNANDGTLTLKVSFDVGSDLDMANVLTQNKLSEAMPQLPASVKTYGVAVKKALAFPLLVLSIKSPNGTYDNNFLSNYTTINIQDNLARIKGVGQINLFGGSDYAMRVWLRPDRIARLGITVPDIVNAISQQNTLSPSGQFGGQPAVPGTEFTYTVRTQGRLLDEAEFGEIIVRSNPDGSQVRLKDVARIELGTQLYNAVGRHDAKPAAVLAVFQIPGTNALAVAKEIKATMEELSKRFPRDLEYKVSLDTTLPVEEGINEIVHTLIEAVVLVIIVVFVFLQNWRATLIPLMTVPVSLVGAFIFFPLLGFSINVLSLLGLVLAIGIVVDDAIVVVEAVMHHLEHGMSPKEATYKAMEEVSGPVVAIALILAAVFIPVGFMGGISGMLYQQFAITIAISVLLSAFNALTLSPALSALLLKPPTGKKTLLTPFYRGFNKAFGAGTNAYLGVAGFLVRKLVVSIVLIGGLVFLTIGFVNRIPGGFLPEEDQGYILVNAMLPDASSLQRTDAVMRKVEQVLAANEGVEGYNTISGFSLLTGAYSSNMGFFFVQLKPWEERHTAELHANGILRALNAAFAKEVPEAIVAAFGPPAIPGLGTGAGFTMQLQDRVGHTPQWLAEQAAAFIETARKRPEIGRISTLYRANVPQVYADIDRSKVLKVGVPIADVNTTLGALLGSSYVNDFNRFGRVYKVYVQAEPEFRHRSETARPVLRAQREGRHGAARHRGVDAVDDRARVHEPVQSLPRGGNHGRAGRRLQLGPGAEGPRGGRRRSAVPGHGLRVGRHVLPGAAGAEPRAHLRRRDPARLPGAGGPVRELVAAVQRPAGHTVRGVRGLLRPLARAAHVQQLREQHLRADRAHHADRPRGEERDPHRGIRQDAARPGQGRRDRGHGVGEAPVPPDPDDGLRLHPGRDAARAGERRRRRITKGHGHDGVRRDAHRHHSRRPVDPDAVRPGRQADRIQTRDDARDRPAGGRRGGRGRPLMNTHHFFRALPLPAAVAALALAAAGCTVGPELRAAEAGAAGAAPRACRRPRRAPESVADLPWWQLFQDPALQALIRDGVANNLDLRVASARVVEARALAGIAKSFLYPEIGAGFGTAQEQASRVGDPKLSKEQVPDRTYSNWALTGTLSWEIDLFGRLRRGQEAAVAQYLATEEGRKALLVTLVGDIASTYFYLRELDRSLEIARRTVKVNDETVDLLHETAQGRRLEPPGSGSGQGEPRRHGRDDPRHRAPDRHRRERAERAARPASVGDRPLEADRRRRGRAPGAERPAGAAARTPA